MGDQAPVSTVAGCPVESAAEYIGPGCCHVCERAVRRGGSRAAFQQTRGSRAIGLPVRGSRSQPKDHSERTVDGAHVRPSPSCPLPLGHCWGGQTHLAPVRRPDAGLSS